MKWYQIHLSVCLLTALLSTVLTWLCRRLAPRFGFVDKPQNEAHKNHSHATPVFGGMAMWLSWFASIAGGLAIVLLFKDALPANINLHTSNIAAVKEPLAVILICATGMTFVGLVDDRFALRASTKFAGQILFAGISAAWGCRITAFLHSPILTWGITVFWILFIVNALNFLDNMDGLAAGISAIAAALFLFTAAARGQHFVAVLAAVTLGSACGFLVFNKPKASIFMGDSGSHFLGYNLALLGALTTFYTTSSPTLAPVVSPLLILGVPLFDTVAVVVIRLYLHKPIYVGDNRHISHRFQALGLSRPVAVLLVCLLSLLVGCGAVSLLWLPPLGVLVILVQTLVIFTIISLIQFHVPKRDK